jgi:hypothetical protein
MSVTSPISHESASELLPWLANGSLAAAERERVEQHVRSCIVCRRELKGLERLAAAVRNQPTVHLSAQGQFERLERRLDGAPRGGAAPSLGRYASLFRFAAVSVMGVGLLGLLLWLAPIHNDYRSDFATLASAPATGGGQIDLIFNPTTTDAEIRQLLAEIDGTIVAGPTSLGRYTVRVASGSPNDSELQTLLAKLARDPGVRFAGRSYSESGP